MYITSLPKEIQLCFQFDSFSYEPAVHLISWKTFVSHALTMFISLRDNAGVKKLNGVMSHSL